MIINSPSEIAFKIFDFPVYWYGIIMAISVLTGFYVADFLSKFRDIKHGFIIDISPLLILLGLIGARLYYCLVNFSYYAEYPLQILNIRQGGLSIHGMLIAGLIFIIFVTKKNKINIWNLLDVFACSVPLAQAIGRWGNFFNTEAFGFPTNSNWGLFVPLAKRPIEYAQYSLFHPAFLYESILDLALFFVLFLLLRKTKKSGVIFALYLILYSVVRIFVESIRIDSVLDVLGLPVAQIVSAIFIVIGVIILIYLCKKRN